jgi:hypothetical protein
VRYVTLKPAVAVAPQKRPMGSAVQPSTQRIPPPKVVHAPRKARNQADLGPTQNVWGGAFGFRKASCVLASQNISNP